MAQLVERQHVSPKDIGLKPIFLCSTQNKLQAVSAAVGQTRELKTLILTRCLCIQSYCIIKPLTFTHEKRLFLNKSIFKHNTQTNMVDTEVRPLVSTLHPIYLTAGVWASLTCCDVCFPGHSAALPHYLVPSIGSPYQLGVEGGFRW